MERPFSDDGSDDDGLFLGGGVVVGLGAEGVGGWFCGPFTPHTLWVWAST